MYNLKMLLLATFFCLRIATSLSGLRAPAALIRKDTIHWLTFSQLTDSMRVHPKPIFISVGTNWCQYCRLQERNTYTHPAVINQLNRRFYAVRLDAESKEPITLAGRTYTYQPTGTTTGNHQLALFLARINGTLAYPTVVVLNRRFELVSRQAGLMEPKDLVKMLDAAVK